jgi:hypothetical protein
VTEEVYTYVPEVQEILEGRFPVRDTQLAEYKNVPSPFAGETFPAVLMAGLSRITGTVESAFMAADFIFPPLAVWLIYRLSRGIGTGGPLAILTGAAAIITTKLIELTPYPQPLWDFLVNLKGSDDFLFFSRNFNPQLSFLLFGGMMLVVTEAIKNGGRKRIAIAGGLIGAQFYTYFFSWTATLAMLMILLFWQGAERNWAIVKRLVLISLIGFVLALPYAGEMFRFRISPTYWDFFLKNSLPARSFVLVSVRYVILILAVFWLTRGKRSLPLTVLTAAALATILLPEAANLFLGRDPEGKHWIRRLLIPLSFPLAAVVCDEVYRRQTFFKLKRRVSSALILIGLVTIFLFGVRVQILASERYARWFYRQEDKQSLFDWFNLYGNAGETVATLSSGLIAEIPAFTKLDNAVPVTTRSIATTEETVSRFLEVARLYRLSPDDVGYLLWTGDISVHDPERVRILEGIVPDSKGSWVSRLFYFTANDNGNIFSLSREKREAVIGEYEEGLGAIYRIDYILIGPFEKRILKEDVFAGKFQAVYKNGSYEVYRAKN